MLDRIITPFSESAWEVLTYPVQTRAIPTIVVSVGIGALSTYVWTCYQSKKQVDNTPQSSSEQVSEGKKELGVSLVKAQKEDSSYLTISGNERTLDFMKACLLKAEKASVFIAGPIGSGKTSLVKYFARELAKNEDPKDPFSDYEILSITKKDLDSLLNEERPDMSFQKLLTEIKAHPKRILFIDDYSEVMSQLNQISPKMHFPLLRAIEEGEVRVIATIYPEQYDEIKNFKDIKIAYTKFDVQPPTGTALREIVEAKIKEKYSSQYGVVYTDEAIQAAIIGVQGPSAENFSRLLTVLDTAGSHAKLSKATEVLPIHITYSLQVNNDDSEKIGHLYI